MERQQSIIPAYDYAGGRVAKDMIEDGFDGNPSQLAEAVLTELQGSGSAFNDEQADSVRAGVDRAVAPMRRLSELPFFRSLVAESLVVEEEVQA